MVSCEGSSLVVTGANSSYPTLSPSSVSADGPAELQNRVTWGNVDVSAPDLLEWFASLQAQADLPRSLFARPSHPALYSVIPLISPCRGPPPPPMLGRAWVTGPRRKVARYYRPSVRLGGNVEGASVAAFNTRTRWSTAGALE